jgi:hypothetical protein
MSFFSKYKALFFEYGIVILIGCFSYFINFYSILSRFSSHIFYLTEDDDAKIYVWNTWHFTQQLDQGLSPFFTDYFFNPLGSDLWMHANTCWFGLINYIVRDIELAVNLGILVQLIVAFLGFYILSKKIVVKPFFAIVVAYVSVFNTFILVKCGVHFNLVLIGVVPFIIIMVMKTFPFQESTYKLNRVNLVALILLLVLAFFMDYYMVFYGLSFLVIYISWFFGLDKWFRNWNRKKTLGLFGIFVFGHTIVRLLRVLGFDEKGALWGASDIRLLFTPSIDSFFFNHWSISGLTNSVNDNKNFIGFSLIFLLIMAVFIFVKRFKGDGLSRFLIFTSCSFFLITFPLIRIGGNDLFFHFSSIIHFVPFVNNVRSPDRFILMLFVFLGLFSFRVFYLFSKDRLGFKSFVFTFLFVLGFYIDHTQKPMNSFEINQGSSVLSQTKNKNVLIIPYGVRDGFRSFGEFEVDHVLSQIKHGFKMPSGYLSRMDADIWDYSHSEFFKNVVNVQSDSSVIDYDWRSNMIKHKIDYVYVPNSYRNKNQKILCLVQNLKLMDIDTYGSLYLVE